LIEWHLVWEAVTALASVLLTIGVVFAAAQFFLQRKSDRVAETGRLLQEWYSDRLWWLRTWLDKEPASKETDRLRALNFYIRIKRLGKRKTYREIFLDIEDGIEELARLAERIEIYVRARAASEQIIFDHIGYDILMSYIILSDVLALRASTENLSYEGFRDLALRCQDYAKLHPLAADIDDTMVWKVLPKLKYIVGGESEGYSKSILLKLRLRRVKRPNPR
jgi:hypothetical protein